MTSDRFKRLIDELCAFPTEAEWLEFKHNHLQEEDIGKSISALANGAALKDKAFGYLVFGIEDETHNILGTTYSLQQSKKGNEPMLHWLMQRLDPRFELHVYEEMIDGQAVVVIKIPRAKDRPVRFMNNAYVRIGSVTRSLKDFPEIEKQLWLKGHFDKFEKGICRDSLSADDVVRLLDCQGYFDKLEIPFPSTRDAILEKLVKEKFVKKVNGHYQITNLGGILFAKNLNDFEGLGRKAVRVIVYDGNNRINTLKDQTEVSGYAICFERLIDSILDKLPSNEEIKKALRKSITIYPPLAIRELVANALIHQDFQERGTGPMVEIFSDRIEITNSGKPIIQTDRFIDEYQSRNEDMASFLRRIGVCEEKGSGVDKVIFQVEVFQLPAPSFEVKKTHTKATLYNFKNFQDMDREDKIRACYQHCCLKYVSNEKMANETLRDRFKIDAKNSAIVSRIIGDTLKKRLIRYEDPDHSSRKFAKYVLYWA